MTVATPTVFLAMASDTDRAPSAFATALLDEAGIAWSIGAPEAVGKTDAVVICLARPGSGLPAQCARATQSPVLAVPWPDELPTSPQLLLDALANPAELGIGILAIGEAGMKNAALAAISIIALQDERVASWWAWYRKEQTESVLADRELP